MILSSENGMTTKTIEDQWCDSSGIRVLDQQPWWGKTYFDKSATDGVPATRIHSSLTQLQQLSSQGGQIIIYHDRDLAEGGEPSQTTIAAWRSFRLKWKTVDTLAAEGQALQAGIGRIHWHRLMFLEAFHGMMSTEQWRSQACKLPFLAAVDSKSLYDATNKCTSTTAYISDKRTAIDIAVIKADLLETSRKIRWIDTRAMLADPLTKAHPGQYLRYVMKHGLGPLLRKAQHFSRRPWSEKGRKLMRRFLCFGDLDCDRCVLGFVFPKTCSLMSDMSRVFQASDC